MWDVCRIRAPPSTLLARQGGVARDLLLDGTRMPEIRRTDQRQRDAHAIGHSGPDTVSGTSALDYTTWERGQDGLRRRPVGVRTGLNPESGQPDGRRQPRDASTLL